MRILLLPFLFLFAAGLAVPVGGQARSGSPDLYKFGTVNINIPAPQGFFDVFPKYPRLKDRFISTQGAATTAIAVHVPDELRKDLDLDQDIALPFYSRVSVGLSARTLDIDLAQYKEFVGALDKQFDKALDPNGPAMRQVVSQVRKGLDKHFESESGFDLKATQNLGYFQREAQVYSGMILMSVEFNGSRVPLLATYSVLHIKKRVFYVQVYRRLTDDKDAEILRDITKKWTAAIIAANK